MTTNVTSLLQQAIERYQNNLDLLERANNPNVNTVLEALLSRDVIFDFLQNEPQLIKIDQLDELMRCDKILRHQEPKISKHYMVLEKYRKIKLPPIEAWWWYFFKPVHWLNKLDWLWNLCTLFCLGFSTSISIEIISRILEGGGDIFLSIIAAIQASLTIWIGKSLLTQDPGKTITNLLKKSLKILRVDENWHAELSFMIAAMIAGFTILFRSHLIPLLSIYHTNVGQNREIDNKISQAFFNYQRAISLDPENIQSQYYLASLYDKLSITQKAKLLYEKAILEDYITAYNNLGRLLIIEEKYASAFQVLLKGKEFADEKSKDSSYANTRYQIDNYSLQKNLGWVQFKQGDLDDARYWLEKSIKQGQKIDNKKTGAAHCLMAQVLEAQYTATLKTDPNFAMTDADLDKIRDEWLLCQYTSNKAVPEEFNWSKKAKEKTLDNLKKQFKQEETL